MKELLVKIANFLKALDIKKAATCWFFIYEPEMPQFMKDKLDK